jgi:putative ATP-binding cassette transporter
MATDATITIPATRLPLPGGDWLRFLRQFLRLAGPYWNSAEKWRVRGLTAALIVLTIGQVALAVALNRWIEGLFDALEQRALDRFLLLIVLLGVIILANAGVIATHLRVKRRIQVDWRAWLTRKVVDDWMTDGRHYQVSLTPGEHDNPDGRIAEDVRIATEYAIDLGHSLFYCIVLLVSFAQILWVLSAALHFHFDGFDVHVPGHMVWVAILYSVTGTTVALLLGRPLVRAANNRQTGEANFRFGLVHGRENALAIALLRGEAEERRRFFELFGGAARAWNGQTNALTYIFLFSASWSVLSQVFPILVTAPHYIAGVITLGILMQTAQAFQQMTGALAWPIDNLARAAEWRASVERVQSLEDGLVRLKKEQLSPEVHRIDCAPSDRPTLAFEECTIATPSGAPLVDAFSLEVHPRDRVLVSGDATAIAALFKVVAGLWPWGRGHVTLPCDARPFFMPPRTYLPVSPLRDAVSYPAPPGSFDEAALRRALLRVGLDHLVARLDDTDRWENALTIDEQQRLGFARLLLHRPSWIYIQEATDALDTRAEEEMVGLLATDFAEATIVMTGRGPALRALRTRTLAARRTNGSATVSELAPSPAVPT